MKTRKSSCVNARGIPPTMWQVLAMSQVRGGTPSQVWGRGVAHPRSRGYPIPGLGGTLSQVWGYPIPGPGGYPILGLEGTPSHVQGGTLSQVEGVPCPMLGVPCPRSGGYPPSRPGMGYPLPPGQTWDGVSPRPRPDLG